MIVFAFNHPDFREDVVAELERVDTDDTVREIDALAVYKDADGEIELQAFSDETAWGVLARGDSNRLGSGARSA